MSQQSGGEAMPPLAYHDEMVAFLRRSEPHLWTWMAAGRLASTSDRLRRDLLSSTYRLDSDGHPGIVRAAQRAADAVGVRVPVSIYQTEGEVAPNAALVFVPDEAIVLLTGAIAELLEDAEMTAVFGHELAHHVLWTCDGGDHLVVDRLVNAMLNDTGTATLAETARRLSLTTELFADRGALRACGDLHTTVAALVKVATGMRSVSAVSYLGQAEEVIRANWGTSAAASHPETFIRVIALRDWAENESGVGRIDQLLLGPLDVDRLDLVDQACVSDLTEYAVHRMLGDDWMRTDAVLGHARAFFSSAGGRIARADPRVGRAAADLSLSTRRYLAFVLLDLAVADPQLEHQPLIEAAGVAADLGISTEWDAIVDAELRLSPSDLSSVRRDAAARLRSERGDL